MRGRLSSQPRRLDDLDRRTIREQLEAGVSRERIALDLHVTVKQVDAIRAHVTMFRQSLTKKEMLNRAHRYAIARARAKGQTTYLTRDDCDWLWQKQNGRCQISGVRFSDTQVSMSAKVLSRPWRPSLDRIDAHGGYEKANVRLVAQIVNFGLSEWPLKEFLKMCRMVVKHHAGRKVEQPGKS